MAEPILQWMGSKRRLLKYIKALFPKNYRNRTFHEPMFGGGAVTFYLAPYKGTINDISLRLIRFYKVIRDNPDELIEENKKLKYEGNNKTDYYRARDEFNKMVYGEKLDEVKEASLLLYLNRNCFRAQYHENAKGEFTVPFGENLDMNIIHGKQIIECSRVLKNMEILNKDFSYIVDKAESGDLIYFDPPYSSTSKKAGIFAGYSNRIFGFEEHKRLRDACIELNKNGVFFVLSNTWAEPIRALYEEIEEFEINQIIADHYISGTVERSEQFSEMLVTNVPKEERAARQMKINDFSKLF